MSAKMYHMPNADAGVVSSLQSHSLYTKWRTFRARGGGALPYKRLMGMCRWMESHFDDWIDYNGVPFSIALLEWVHTFSDFWGEKVVHIYG